MMDMPMMKMYFHTGHEKHVLFYNWHAESPGAMFGACCAVFVMSVLYEGLRQVRAHLNIGSSSPSRLNRRTDSEISNLLTDTEDQKFLSSISSRRHITQTVLHMIQAILSYSLMLVFMTFNIWLCLALVLGLGAGYFLFGWKQDTLVAVDAGQCH